jgi:hypothetical protein
LPSQAINIPTQLKANELSDVVQILGYDTSSKFLSNPYPLGGYSGFEVGVDSEFINSADLSKLGAGTTKQSSFQYNRVSIGKGLYNNIDGFVHFVPFSSSNEISEYGGILKWNFYQAKYLPISLSALTHVSTINIQDSFINETIGWDLMSGINLNRLALYFGVGDLKARSTFTQNILDASIILNGDKTYIVHSSQAHSYVGLNIEIASLFLAAQIDRYEQPVYSVKIGFRF